MKRDMELIRKMVLAVEDAPSGYAPRDLAIGSDYTSEQVGYHAYQLLDGGYAEGVKVTPLDAGSPGRVPLDVEKC